MKWLRLWFGFAASVDRRIYLWSGIGLMALRVAMDTSVILMLSSLEDVVGLSAWSPLIYVAPTMYYRSELLQEMLGLDLGGIAGAILFATALPFAWIGTSMSFRRAKDAGVSPWIGMAFLVPVVNFLVIAALCSLPTASTPTDEPKSTSASAPPLAAIFPAAMIAVGWSALFGLVVTALSVMVLGDYGSALFMAGPIIMGAISGWHINRDEYRGNKAAMFSGLFSGLLCGGLLLLFALEGVVCLFMVAPLAAGLTVVGALFGAALARSQHDGKPIAAMALMLPIMGVGDTVAPGALPVHSMVSEIVIDAPPEVVWPNVVGFSELPPPSDWVLKTGISTPLRAHIDGEGVGAVRYCVFTTGPFVEPITVWDPPQRLGFDVSEQPDPMHEWSPYEVVYAPHLENTMISQRGEFHLIPTDDGGTLLRGTTWYSLDIDPVPYWRLWSDFVVHRIHMRVLRHVKNLSEDGAG